ncbi:UDP-glucose 4-epimerase [Arthroderma uncinatum]|uniref:UDP-glucose 4-epimerase n=1 Tax=Arthroderma uncinatum TaxID=74035 RepID=UPI00144A53B1|nr:UDP-glucose 4-epimerase [Arthroderma uncinatum]KAF3483053.1 UDP-glucose 4-epimerase [Arthroderma uncinatum]
MATGSVLVTGGTGYIGSFTALALLEAGYKVVVVDNLYNSSQEALNRIELICGKRPEFVELDVRDEGAFDKVFDAHPDIDSVIHFAALKAVGESTERPLDYYDINVHGSLCLLRSMVRHNVYNIVFSSSATVYGDATRFPNMIPIPEECPLGPTNPYGNTKVAIESAITDVINAERTRARKAGKPENAEKWNAALLRYFNPAGAHPSGIMGEDPQGVPYNLLPLLAQVANGKREKLLVFGDGTGKGSTVLEMVKAFSAAVGRDLPYEVAPRRDGDVLDLTSNPSRANKELGWKAQRDLHQACEDLWRWTDNNPQGYRQSPPEELLAKLKAK